MIAQKDSKFFELFLVLNFRRKTDIIILFLAAKDESKSPVRTSGRISVTAPPSRKTSTANNVSKIC